MSTTMMSHTTTTVMPSVHRSGVVADTITDRINVIPASAAMIITDTIAVRINIISTSTAMVVTDAIAIRVNIISASAAMVVTDTIAVRINIANTLSLLRAITGENSRRYQRQHQ